jgi:hypothetical protein
MGLSKLSLLLLAAFLAIGVALREAPQCATLTDDVSNDGELVQGYVFEAPDALFLVGSPPQNWRSVFTGVLSFPKHKRFSISFPVCDCIAELNSNPHYFPQRK